MPRYNIRVLLRQDDEGKEDGYERVLQANITAPSETQARRMVLERTYGSGLLVSRFLSVKESRSK